MTGKGKILTEAFLILPLGLGCLERHRQPKNRLPSHALSGSGPTTFIAQLPTSRASATKTPMVVSRHCQSGHPMGPRPRLLRAFGLPITGCAKDY